MLLAVAASKSDQVTTLENEIAFQNDFERRLKTTSYGVGLWHLMKHLIEHVHLYGHGEKDLKKSCYNLTL